MVSIHIVGYNRDRVSINAILSAALHTADPFEILFLENGPDEEGFQRILECPEVREAVAARGLNMELVIKVLRMRNHGEQDVRNFGLAAGLNTLYSFRNPATTHILQMHADMILFPNTISLLVKALENPQIGIACPRVWASLPGIDRLNPSVADVYASIPEGGTPIGLVGFPMMMTPTFLEELRTVDVWFDKKPLFCNRTRGCFDEAIDPSPAHAAFIAEDVCIRASMTRKRAMIVQEASCFHYNAAIELEKESQQAKANFIQKYGSYPYLKPTVSQRVADGYPQYK